MIDIKLFDGEDHGEGPVGYELTLDSSNWDSVHAHLARGLNNLTGIVATAIGPRIRIRDDHEPEWLMRQISRCVIRMGRNGRIHYVV